MNFMNGRNVGPNGTAAGGKLSRPALQYGY